MAIPLSITFRDMHSSAALEERIREWTTKLERVFDRVDRCEVLIERPHKRHRQGQRVHVRVTLSVPGPDVVVSHDHALDGAHEDTYVALRDAFLAARRQLEIRAQRLRRDVKTHALP